LHNGVDNRLTENLIEKALKPALDAVEKEWREVWRASKEKGKNAAKDEGKGSLIIVGRRTQDKFFSNGMYYPSESYVNFQLTSISNVGLDYENARKNPNFFPCKFFIPMVIRALTFEL
jgi:Delta3-Delta2-enoyl-CoA isomerase